MGNVYRKIDPDLARWIERQKVCFVATAPLAGDGHINCSPRGGDAFRILDQHTVAWQDYTGSGVETIAHLRENGRIVIMFCAFEGPPKIVRLHGEGRVFVDGDEGYPGLLARFPHHPGTRAVIQVDVTRISDSCGYSVPLYEFREHRDVLDRWSAEKGAEGLEQYRRDNNATNIDGLPGLG